MLRALQELLGKPAHHSGCKTPSKSAYALTYLTICVAHPGVCSPCPGCSICATQGICYVIIHAARHANLRAEQEGGVRLRGSQVSNLPFHFTALHSHRSQQSKKHTCTSGGSEVHHCPVARRISSLLGQGDPNGLSPFVVLALAAWPSQAQQVYQARSWVV